MASIVKDGKKKGNQTTAEVLADQEQQALKQVMSEAVTNGNANVAVAQYAEDREVNAMLTTSGEMGVELSSHAEFNSDMGEIVHAQEVLDYKSIGTLKWFERFLSRDRLALLPMPGLTMDEAKAKRKEGDNTPLLFDKPKASGGSSKVETFYGNLVKHTPLGNKAHKTLEALDKEDAQHKIKPESTRNSDQRNTDRENANRTINNMLSAVKTAAKIRIQLDTFKEQLPHIRIKWVREESETEFDLPDTTDWTQVYIQGAGEVKQSRKVLRIWSKRSTDGEAGALRYPVGTFLRWKCDKAIAISKANGRNYPTMDDVIASGTAPPKKPKETPPTSAVSDAEKDKRWRPTDMVAVKRSTEGWLKWYRGDSPVTQAANEMELVKQSNASEELNASLYAQYKVLERIFSMNSDKETKAKEYWAKAGEKAA
jgi:hypothetical protein